jgi:hypothetical protein
MPTSTVNLDYKLEQAVLNWLGASATHSQTLTTTNLFHADATGTYALPCIIVRGTVGEEHLYNSGHFRCTVDVTLRTQVNDTTAATAETEWQKVRAILGWDELAARLSDLSDFHCWIVIRDQGERSEEAETHQDRIYSFTVICMATDNS